MAMNQNSASSSLLSGHRQGPRKGEAASSWLGLLNKERRDLRAAREEIAALKHQLKAAEARAELAEIDPLTGLPNRRAFDRAMRTMINHYLHNSQQAPWVIAFFDLDNFKKVNDIYGHAVGDAVLQSFGRKMTAEFREGDMLCRIGGEEFVLIAQTQDPEQFIQKVHEIQRKFDAYTPEVEDQTRFSVGFATLNLEFLARAFKGTPITQIRPKDLETILTETADHDLMKRDKPLTRGWLRDQIKKATSREAEADAVATHYKGRSVAPAVTTFTPQQG